MKDDPEETWAGERSEFAGQAVERFEHPFVQATAFLQNIRLQGHACLQGLRLAISGDLLRVQRDGNPVVAAITV